mgnify:FL=1
MQYFRVLLTIIIFYALSINSCCALSRAEITHLLMRTSFGIQTNQVSSLLKLDRKQSVELILTKVRTEHYIDPPKWLREQAINKNKRFCYI